MSNTEFTPGPWFADGDKVWRRDPSELYERGGTVAGDKPVACAYVGWYGDDVQGFPAQANARLIAAAPELYTALEGVLNDLGQGFPSRAVLDTARDALKKARGEQ